MRANWAGNQKRQSTQKRKQRENCTKTGTKPKRLNYSAGRQNR